MNPEERETQNRGISHSQSGVAQSTPAISSGKKVFIHADMGLKKETEVVRLMQDHYGIHQRTPTTSIKHLGELITKNSVLDTLVICAHGQPGAILVNGTSLSLDQLAAALPTNKSFQINSVYFEGCNVLEGNLKGTFVFGKKINAKEINGFNFAHLFQRINYIVPKKIVNFDFFKNYFAIGSKIDRNSTKSQTIWFEWFYTSLQSPKLINKEEDIYKSLDPFVQIELRRGFKQRKHAVGKIIDSKSYRGGNSIGLASFENIKIIF